ncbi:hypothetical protein U6A24_15795 [Aquimarina gracilis]|uniref:Lipoprotein n=1 Tax=Aquimarina gracilis TaxID=874422 RepID=A0ABU5ZYL0_9FLAO|nr:hypothetical protein [Aquimarina gracilis]MEB3346937.1 hypothetical protein [Aquimarina gracilis]
MKKLALLILATIFVIGIQGCSTNEEETTSTQQENSIPDYVFSADYLLGNKNLPPRPQNKNLCFERIFVVFPSNSTDLDNLDYLERARRSMFSEILAATIPYCDDVYEWYVPCNETPNRYCDPFLCAPQRFPKSEGEKTHAAETLSLSEDPDGDPACNTCDGTSGWGRANNASCEEIKRSLFLR